MRSRLMALAACGWLLASTAGGSCDTITIQPKIFPFSTFNLITGVAFDGKSFWLADMSSNASKLVVRLDANYAIAHRVSINSGTQNGLMLASDGKGLVYAANEMFVWQISQTGAVKTLTPLGIDNCSQQNIAADASFVWLLASCSIKDDTSPSAGLLLFRLDPKTGKRSVVALPQGDGNHVTISHGKIWVCNKDCTIVDANTLATDTFRLNGTESVGAVTASDKTVYLAAQTSGGTSQFIIAVDPGTLKETARGTIQDFIVNLAADGQNVVAFGQEKFHVLAVSDLSLQRVITPSPTLQQYHADAAFILNGDLVVADDEMGVPIPNRILVFQGWRPPAAPAPK